MDKKGNMFTEESMKIVLALLSIVALLYLAASFYSLFTVKTQTEQARGTLDGIIAKLDSVSSNDKYLVESPKDWYLFFYSAEKIPYEEDNVRPAECAGKNCLCLCGEGKGCSVVGVCKPVKREVVFKNGCPISSNLKCLPLDKIPGNIVLENLNDKITLFYGAQNG